MSAVLPYGIRLLEASKRGDNTEVMSLLGKADLDRNYVDQAGSTALMWAAYNGHLDVVNILLPTEKNVDKQNMGGCTALMCASMMGHVDIINKLVLARADVNAVSNANNNTALMFAAQSDYLMAVTALLQAGADSYKNNKACKSALDLAASKEIRNALKAHRVGRPVTPPHPTSQLPLPPHLATVLPQHASSSGNDSTTVSIPSSTNATSTSTFPQSGQNSISAASSKVDYSALGIQVQQFLVQAAGVQARREWMQRRDAAQAQYDTAKAADEFALCAKLGKSKLAIESESATLVLSLDNFKTLVERREEWVNVLTAACKELAHTETDFDALEHLSHLLESVKSLDASELAYPQDGSHLVSLHKADVKTVVIDDMR